MEIAPSINYLGGLTKVVGHIKVAGSEKDYEPALYIINEVSPRFQGRAFIIALSALGKYVEPFFKYSAPKLIEKDRQIFEEKRQKAFENRSRLLAGIPPVGHALVTPYDEEQVSKELGALAVADMLSRSNGFLLVTAYNIAQCMQMFDITPCPQAAAQLLMLIEDSLDDLKNMGPPEPDKMFNAGGYQINIEGEKVSSGDWTIPETKVVEERYFQ